MAYEDEPEICPKAYRVAMVRFLSLGNFCEKALLFMVPRRGLEPPHLAEQASETCVSTISPPGLTVAIMEM
jgi:hypothetical protein